MRKAVYMIMILWFGASVSFGQEKHVSGIELDGTFQGERNLNISPDTPNVTLEGSFFDDGEVNFNVHFKAFLDGLAEYFNSTRKCLLNSFLLLKIMLPNIIPC